jgi:putative SOS response-associated peptidase YedK
MCGRFSLTTTDDDIKKRFNLQNSTFEFKSATNISPGSMIPIIVNTNHKDAVLAKWGLIPFWAKDPKIGFKMFNARSETILEKSSFRKPFLSQRCLIPATGYYEWQHIGDEKIPYLFYLPNQPIFTFAGLYDIWKDAEGYPLTSCTIITTAPNEFTRQIHDRMPVIIAPELEDKWLDAENHDQKELQNMLRSYPDKEMEMQKIKI